MQPHMRFYSLWLAGILAAVFVAQQFLSFPLSWEVGTADARFFVAMLAHSSMAHILGNLFALIFFGILTEGTVGSKRFVLLLLVAGIAAQLASIPAGYTRVLGASGALYGVIGALAVLRPRMVVWVSIPAPMLLVAIGYIFVDSIGLFANTGTGHAAHIAGAIVGALLAWRWRKDVPPYRGMEFPPRKEKRDDDERIEQALNSFERSYMR